MDNTCTDSLVTALDDEALLINDYMNDMAKSKVSGTQKMTEENEKNEEEGGRFH